MSETQKVSTGYPPRELQAELHRNMKRFNVLVCHRRFGKTVFAINHMIHMALNNPIKNPQYAYVAPMYSQAKRIAWDYMKEYTKNIPGMKSNEQDLRIDIPLGDTNIRFFCFGADNPDSHRGIYLDGAVLDEYSEMNPRIWTQILRPALSDRKGWGVFIGTPAGRNTFYDLYVYAKTAKNWYSKMYKASETGIIEEDELISAKAIMDEDEYAQEFECSFDAGLKGSYYGRIMTNMENDGRIREVPFHKDSPVTTAWDLGIDDLMIVWFIQKSGPSWNVINYMEQQGYDIPKTAEYLNSLHYNYDTHLLPHDGGHRDLSTGVKRSVTLQKLLNSGRVEVVPKYYVDDGIHATRMLLPKCYIDRTKCFKGIEHMKAYRKKWDRQAGMFIATPRHDIHSHAADAFRTFAMGVKEQKVDHRSLPRQASQDYTVYGGHI